MKLFVECKDPNSYATECGSACEATCKNPKQFGPCPDVCVKGCFCNPGFLKNDTGVCVSAEKCPKGNNTLLAKYSNANQFINCSLSEKWNLLLRQWSLRKEL